MRASLVLCAALAACATADPDPDWLSHAPVAAEAAAAPAAGFAVPAALELGFDAQVAGGRIAFGDRVLFGVRLDRDGEVDVCFVQVEVVGVEVQQWELPFALAGDASAAPAVGQMPFARVHATVCDADGRALGDDTVVLHALELEHGLVAACRGDGPAETRCAINALRNVLHVVRGSAPLRALLWQVVDVPSLFSLLWHFGVKVSLAENFAGSQRGAATALGAATVATWEAPLELRLNGAPALRCRVLVTDPDAPWALCAGVVAIQAASPSHPQRTVTMRLLGARRGARP
jgi:hypothetical protein